MLGEDLNQSAKQRAQVVETLGKVSNISGKRDRVQLRPPSGQASMRHGPQTLVATPLWEQAEEVLKST